MASSKGTLSGSTPLRNGPRHWFQSDAATPGPSHTEADSNRAQRRGGNFIASSDEHSAPGIQVQSGVEPRTDANKPTAAFGLRREAKRHAAFGPRPSLEKRSRRFALPPQSKFVLIRVNSWL